MLVHPLLFLYQLVTLVDLFSSCMHMHDMKSQGQDDQKVHPHVPAPGDPGDAGRPRTPDATRNLGPTGGSVAAIVGERIGRLKKKEVHCQSRISRCQETDMRGGVASALPARASEIRRP